MAAAQDAPGPSAPSARRPVHVEVGPRARFKERVDGLGVGDELSFAFYTGRKNIAFGLYYVLPPADPGSDEDAALRAHAEAAVAACVAGGALSVQPPSKPKPGHGAPSAEARRAAAALARTPSRASMEAAGARLGAHPLYAAGPQTSSSDGALPLSPPARDASAASLPDMRAFQNGKGRDAPERYVEVLPVERYESSEATVRGRLVAPLPGSYVLYFDNTYSISTPKELFLTVAVSRRCADESDAPAPRPSGRVRPAAVSTRQLLERRDVFGGWLLKRRRMHGWARRWFTLDDGGRLAYAADRFSPARGALSVARCAYTWVPAKLQFSLDVGGEVLHLRAESGDAYARWHERLTAVRGRLAADDGARAPDAPLPLPPALAAAQRDAAEAMAALRAAASALGPDVPDALIGRLGAAGGALDALCAALAAHVAQVAAPRSAAAAPLAGAPTDDEFFDAQDAVLADVSDAGEEERPASVGASSGSASPLSPGSPAPSFVAQSLLLSSDEDLSSVVGPSDVSLATALSGTTTFGLTVSGLTIAGGTLPGSTVSGETIAGETVSGSTISGLTISGSTTSGSTMAGSTLSASLAPIPPTPSIAVDAHTESGSTLVQHQTPTALQPSQECPFRTRMPVEATPNNVRLASLLMRGFMGGAATRSAPVRTNEPLSVLQRLAEDLHYSALLDRAAAAQTRLERISLVAAFAVSCYACLATRAARKPFTPMLGETFEYVRPDRGLRLLAEKVLHKPLSVVACHAQGGLSGLEAVPSGAHPPASQNPAWEYWHDQTLRTPSWGKSYEIVPLGRTHVRLTSARAHFVWGRVVTCVGGIYGDPAAYTLQNYGEARLEDVVSGDTAHIVFRSASETPEGGTPNEVSVAVALAPSAAGEGPLRATLRGRWDRGLWTSAGAPLWLADELPPDAQRFWGFSPFSATLNDIGPYAHCAPSTRHAWPGVHTAPCVSGVLPVTDSRLRPDQRLHELGRPDDADREKVRVETAQRDRRTALERARREHVPRWFARTTARPGARGDAAFADPCAGDEGDAVWRISDPDAYWAERARAAWPSSGSLW